MNNSYSLKPGGQKFSGPDVIFSNRSAKGERKERNNSMHTFLHTLMGHWLSKACNSPCFRSVAWPGLGVSIRCRLRGQEPVLRNQAGLDARRSELRDRLKGSNQEAVTESGRGKHQTSRPWQHETQLYNNFLFPPLA